MSFSQANAAPPFHKAKPELLAPAGDWECVRAAVANGADAVYFGLPAFNARMRATNFTAEDLPKLMEYLHERGVKGYAAFNTLIFTDELAAAEEQLLLLARAGVDAAIMQDLGLVSLAREVTPDFHLHASTQMTLTSPEGVGFAQRIGIARAVLARELSLRELAKFHAEAESASLIPLEVFVHGALCVAYSGQCLTSEALGQRSANRGECAQACRMPYELIVDGLKRDLGDRRYLLSPQDLAAVEEIPALMGLGVVSFKIEGRLKTPEYVAAVTQVYRRAIDKAWAAGSRRAPSGGMVEDAPQNETSARRAEATPEAAEAGPDDRYKLEMAFSRGLYSGWMHGVNHQRLVHARFGKKRGALIGEIIAVNRDSIDVRTRTPAAPGDGVVIDAGKDTDREQGGRIYQAKELGGGAVRLGFEYGRIDFAKVQPGNRLWKTDDPQLNRELRKSWSTDLAPVKRTLDLIVSGRMGEPLRVEGHCLKATAAVTTLMALQRAEKRPLNEDTLRGQLGRLGETSFVLGSLENRLQGDVIVPMSELNRLRRELVEKLSAVVTVPVAHRSCRENVVRERLAALAQRRSENSSEQNTPKLTVLCRTLEQIEAALRMGVSDIYADFEDIRRYVDAVALVRNRGDRADAPRAEILLATPRIQKAGEQGFFRLIENARPDGVLIRNLGALDFFREGGLRRIGDFSLNVANPFSAELLMAEKLERLTISYDLNADQVLSLLRAAPPHWFEITLHQHIPMFHMEHCVFAAFLSEGTDHTNCGRPCDTHKVELRDRVGLAHPLKADVGCRNTLFHAQAQSGAAFFEGFRAMNPAAFRVELLLEDGTETERTLGSYQRLFSGKVAAPEMIRELKLKSQLGVTTGTLAVT